jgi:hypothetical protein
MIERAIAAGVPFSWVAVDDNNDALPLHLNAISQ